MLHQILESHESLVPQNRQLAVTADYLSEFITEAKRLGLRFVSIDDLCERLAANVSTDGLCVLTADDGYRDVLLHGMPVFAAHQTPICIYVATSFPDQKVKLWWHVLEDALLERYGSTRVSDAFLSMKFRSSRKLLQNHYSLMPESFFADHFPGFSFQWADYAERYCLSWEDIAALGRNPLVTIGSHGVTHTRMSQLDDDALFYEFRVSREKLQHVLDDAVFHFSYPYGGRSDASVREYEAADAAGYRSAVTTCYGMVQPASGNRMLSLPRISLEEGTRLQRLGSLKDVLSQRLKDFMTTYLPAGVAFSGGSASGLPFISIFA